MSFNISNRITDKKEEKFCLLAANSATSIEEIKNARKKDLLVDTSKIWQGKKVSLKDFDLWEDELEEEILNSAFYLENLANCCTSASSMLKMINPKIIILEDEGNQSHKIMNLFKGIGLSCVKDFKEEGIVDKDTFEAYCLSNRNVLTMLILQNFKAYIGK